MNPNYYKKPTYDSKHSFSTNLYQEIEQIRSLQKQNQKKIRSKKSFSFLQKITLKKKEKASFDFTEVEFLGI